MFIRKIHKDILERCKNIGFVDEDNTSYNDVVSHIEMNLYDYTIISNMNSRLSSSKIYLKRIYKGNWYEWYLNDFNLASIYKNKTYKKIMITFFNEVSKHKEISILLRKEKLKKIIS